VDAGGAREIAGGAVFGGDGEDVAAGTEDGAGAVGSEVEGRGFLADVADSAAAGGEILADFDGDAVDLFGGEFEAVEEAAVFEDDGVVAEGGEFDGELGEAGDLAGGLGAEIVDEEVGLAVLVAFGDEVDAVAGPHGKRSWAGSSVRRVVALEAKS
jgi:hypothetical protein